MNALSSDYGGSSASTFFQEWVKAERAQPSHRRCVIYARYSSEMQDTSESIEVQVSACERYAIEHHIGLARAPFVDRAETGTSTENRKAYQELLRLARSTQRDFDVILTFHTSRWGRGFESEIDEHVLEREGIRIIAVSQPFTADEGVESAFMKGVLRKIDAYYSMQASKYTHAHQSANALRGFKNGGSAPDGYVLDHVPSGKKDRQGTEKLKARLALDTRPGKYDVIEEPRWKVIEFAFTHAGEGRGLRWLAKAIFRQGWRSRLRPEPISSATIRTWLINPLYTGHMVWNRVRFFRKNGRRTYVPNPIAKWVCSPEPSHPGLISKSAFEAVAMKFLRRRGKDQHSRGEALAIGDTEPDNRGRYLLSGLLRCGACEAHYVAAKNIHRRKKTQVYYVCNTKWRRGKGSCVSPNINRAVAEGATLDALLNAVLTEGEIRKFIDAVNVFLSDQSQRSQQELSRIAEEKSRIGVEMDRIKQAILDGANPRAFAQELNERQERIDALDRERTAAETAPAVEQIRYDSGRFIAWLQMLKNNFMTMDFETRRELVRQFVRSIRILPDRSAELLWNPEAVLRITDGPRFPATALMVTTKLCGGTQQANRPCPRAVVLLNFRVTGKARWPFGWEILRQLYPNGDDSVEEKGRVFSGF